MPRPRWCTGGAYCSSSISLELSPSFDSLSESLLVLFLFLLLGSTLYSSVFVSEEELLSLSVLWSTPSGPRGSPATALLLLTESKMHVLPCLLVFLQSWIMPMLGPRLLSSTHDCCPVSKDMQGILDTCPNDSLF